MADEVPTDLLKQVRQVIRDENRELLREFLSSDVLMDVKEVAKTLRVSKRTVESIINAGELTPLWVRGQRRFTSAAVDAYLRNSRGRK